MKELFEEKTIFSKSLLSKTLSKITSLFGKKSVDAGNPLPSYAHSIYVVTDSGVPLYTFPPDEQKSILISGIFGALTLLINSMSRGRQILKEVDYSDMKMLLEQREGFVVAMLIKKENENARDNLTKFADMLSKEIIILEKGVLKTELDEKRIIQLLGKCFL